METNLVACIAISESLRSILGPKGGEKLFVESDGTNCVTVLVF